jgi:hypothetical protein
VKVQMVFDEIVAAELTLKQSLSLQFRFTGIPWLDDISLQ